MEKSGENVLEREVEVCTLIWALSTVLPLIYFGQKDTGKLQPKVQDDTKMCIKIIKFYCALGGGGG